MIGMVNPPFLIFQFGGLVLFSNVHKDSPFSLFSNAILCHMPRAFVKRKIGRKYGNRACTRRMLEIHTSLQGRTLRAPAQFLSKIAGHRAGG
jgi:hypothetical protein